MSSPGIHTEDSLDGTAAPLENIKPPPSLSKCGSAKIFYESSMELKLFDMSAARPFVADQLANEEFLKELILKQKGTANTEEGRAEKHDQQVLYDRKTKHRFIFSAWPGPNPLWNGFKSAQNSIPANDFAQGKAAPNGTEIWGETLFDFYWVQRFPSYPTLRTVSSGSQLLEWCEQNGHASEAEDMPARDCIDRARREAKPQVVDVYDISLLIKDLEAKTRQAAGLNNDSIDTATDGVGCVERPSSIFDQIAYPPAWKDREPFKANRPIPFPTLEEYIPQHLLPKRLTVHDPYDLLSAMQRWDTLDWAQQTEENPDNVYSYRIKRSSEHDSRYKEDQKATAAEQNRHETILNDFLENPRTSTFPKPPGIILFPIDEERGGVPTYVIFPPRAPRSAVSDAHLFISPLDPLGTGHHSFVYHAEWEIPRSLVVPEELCQECIIDDAILQLLEERDNQNETPKKLDKSVFSVATAANDCDASIDPLASTYTGAYRIIQSRCQYQNLERAPYCTHLKHLVHPLTTKVRVAAKISIRLDPHLRNEAKNYQMFPKHFFQHWSGFNVIEPLLDPTPVGPLVPQYYGYYVPEDDDHNRGYLSPILLAEHCGKTIQSSVFSKDDNNECIALCRRLNRSGWIHNSLYQRNILRKAGPLRASPKDRIENSTKRDGYGVDWSFRLIDFGRTERWDYRTRDELEYEDKKIMLWHREQCLCY